MSITVSRARATLTAVLDRVESGEEVTLTRHGKAVAVLIHPKALRHRRPTAAQAAADSLADLLARSRAIPKESVSGLSPDQAEALVTEIRTGRDR